MKKSKQSVTTCSPHCVYFPQNPDEIVSETVVEGVKHREVVRHCRYDGHQIVGWCHCDNKEEMCHELRV